MLLKDKVTGVTYKISNLQMIGLGLIPSLSLFVYGMLLSLVLMVLGVPSNTILIVLVLAFIVETILLLFKKFSPSQIISCVLVGVIICNVIADISKRDVESKKSTTQQINDIVYVCSITRSLKPIPA